MAKKKRQQGSDEQLDRVIEESGEKAEKKFKKRSKDLIGANIRAIPKGDFLSDTLEAEHKDDVARLMAANQIELNKMKGKQSQDKATVLSEYESARKSIREKHKKELAELHNTYTNIMKAYGSRGGEKRKIDTKAEVYDFVRFGFSMLQNMDLPALVNRVSQEKIYERADEKDSKMFPIIEKITHGKDLEKSDYSAIADRLANLSEIDVSKLTVTNKDIDSSLDAIAKTSVLSTAMLLSEGQRFELAKSLTEKYGEKGAMMIHELTKIGYFSVLQTETIFERHYLQRGKAYEQYKKAVSDQTYAKGHAEVAKLKEEGMENLEKFFHTNFANSFLSYKNVLNYEIVGRAALAVAVLNVVVNLKNKDPEAILCNVPMWGGLAIGAYVYDDVTRGGLRRFATKESDEEERKRERTEKEQTFVDSYTSKPQLGRWFLSNLDAINDGFKRVNPEKKDENYHISFAAMGVRSPGRKDGVDNSRLLEETISQWHNQLYFDVKKKDPKAQETYLKEEVYKEQIV